MDPLGLGGVGLDIDNGWLGHGVHGGGGCWLIWSCFYDYNTNYATAKLLNQIDSYHLHIYTKNNLFTTSNLIISSIF